MKTVKALFLLLIVFIVFGLSGGAFFLLMARQYSLAQGRFSEEQLSHVMAVLKMEPDHFKSVVSDLLKKERKPIDQREADLFAERKRLANEWQRFRHEKDLWMQIRDEERTFLRERRNSLEGERKRLDGIRESIEAREKLIAARENAIRTESYKHWLDSLRKTKPAEVAGLIFDRTPEEIAQDLGQLKPTTVSEVLLEFQRLRDIQPDQRERDTLTKKIDIIKEILRDGGLRLGPGK